MLDLSHASDTPTYMLERFLIGLLGIVGVIAAIAILVSIVKWFLDDDESTTMSPVIRRTLSVGGVIAVMSVLVFGGRALTTTFATRSPLGGVSISGTGNNWLPPSYSTSTGDKTLGSVFNEMSNAVYRQSEANKVSYANDFLDAMIKNNAYERENAAARTDGGADFVDTNNPYKWQMMDALHKYYQQGVKDKYGTFGSMSIVGLAQAVHDVVGDSITGGQTTGIWEYMAKAATGRATTSSNNSVAEHQAQMNSISNSN